MSKKRVHALTQGQVWTGEEAKALGLVDNLGHFSDALEWAKKEKSTLKHLEYVDYTPGPRYSLRWIVSALKDQVSKILTEICKKSQKLYMLIYP